MKFRLTATIPRSRPKRSFRDLTPSPPSRDPPQVRLKDYIAKRESGTLKMDKFNKRMATALQKVRPAASTRSLV